MRFLLIFLVFVCFAQCSNVARFSARNSENSDNYSAYVVEYAAITPNIAKNYTKQEANGIMFKNVDQIAAIVETITSNETNPDRIIFFPEYSTGYGPNMKYRDSELPFLEELPENYENSENDKIIPCNSPKWNKSPVFQALSCLAAKKRTHLVYTQGEVEYCVESKKTPCTPDKRFQYNTQVAFDENGRFLAKYRKTHLYYEPAFDSGTGVPIVFKTSFGESFGMLICFDILHATPLLNYVNDLHVQNIAYSSWWVNFPPFLNAVQIHSGISRFLRINIFTSNAGQGLHSSGSGIYEKGDILGYTYNSKRQPQNTIIKQIMTKTSSSFAMKKDSGKKPNLNIKQPKSLFSLKKAAKIEYLPSELSTLIEIRYFQAIPGLELNDKQLIIQNSEMGVSLTANFTIKVQKNANKADSEFFAYYCLSGYVFPVLRGELCGVFKCSDNSEQECAQRYSKDKPSTFFNYHQLDSRTEFENLKVSVEFSKPFNFEKSGKKTKKIEKNYSANEKDLKTSIVGFPIFLAKDGAILPPENCRFSYFFGHDDKNRAFIDYTPKKQDNVFVLGTHLFNRDFSLIN